MWTSSRGGGNTDHVAKKRLTQEVLVSHQDHPGMALSPAPAPKAGTLNTLDKAACSSPAAGSQVASAFKTLGLVPTGPASTLAIQQTGPQTVNTQKARLGFLPDTRKQRVPSAGAGGQSRTATSEHSLLSHSFSKNQNKRSLLCIEGI